MKICAHSMGNSSCSINEGICSSKNDCKDYFPCDSGCPLKHPDKGCMSTKNCIIKGFISMITETPPEEKEEVRDKKYRARWHIKGNKNIHYQSQPLDIIDVTIKILAKEKEPGVCCTAIVGIESDDSDSYTEPLEERITVNL